MIQSRSHRLCLAGILAFAAGAAAAAARAQSPTAAGDREATLRFPPEVLRNAPYAADVDPDYRHAPAAAYDRFRAMKYGVRIHWGLYSMLPGARESWSFLPLSDAERQAYVDSYRKWDPSGFDAEGWMSFFDRAGFKCFTITTKHHEGFSLFDTKTRVKRRVNWAAPGGPAIEDCDVAYSVMETPVKRDLIKELCDAAHRHDVKIDLYFSHSDWYDADFRPYGKSPVQTPGSTETKVVEERQGRPAKLFPEPTPDERARMIERHRAQLKELLTNYGKVDMVCLDINLGKADWPELRRTIKELRAIQPEVMFRNRGIGNYGDYYTPERVVPGDKAASPMPWMVIYPLGTNFSYEADAAKHKGAAWVVRNLADTVAKGGNFMVGIGPDASGKFHPTAVAQLEEVGTWLKVNGQAIYGTHERPGSLWSEGEDVRFTAGDDGRHVYAILLSRPVGGKVALKNVRPDAASKVELLGHPAPLAWTASDAGVSVEFPDAVPESLAYVLKIEAAR